MTPPSGLTYSTNPAVYTAGVGIAPNTPTHAGGVVTSYSVAPSLPAGLALDTSTGVITGTPSAVAATASHVVTATNPGGSTTASLSITVIAAVVPPSNLTYSANPATYTSGVAITPNTPSSSGGAVVSYSVSPALPAGLAFDTSTGWITGTPTAVTATASYVVTATNPGGSATASLSVTVTAPGVPPSGLTYSSNPVTYSTGTPIIPNTPSSSGGAVVSYSVSPALPAGLGLDTTTGVVTGTPTAVTASAGYVVTATNSSGSTTVILTITVAAVSVDRSGVIAGGNDHTCAVVNGGVQCWGRNDHGQLGNGSTTGSHVPVQVSGFSSGAQAIAAGLFHTCAIVAGGARCWGQNADGQLGNNATTDSQVPVPVAGLSSGVQAIAAGGYFTCALVNGGVRCWGDNTYGQVGNGSAGITPVTAPVAVTGLSSGVQAIAAGFAHACALASGGVQCWGAHGDGQLGDGSFTPIYVASPVAVSGLSSGVQAVSAGAYFTCAVASGGAQCWGANGFGQLGNGSTTGSLVPGPVSGLSSGVLALAQGSSHACALVNGGVQCWGRDLDGQLGNGSWNDSQVPVASGLSSGVQAIAAGSYHTCGLANGGLQCWGANAYGQLGNNSTSHSNVPVPVTGLSSGL